MIEGEGALDPVSGDVPRIPVAADIVDQHINPGQAVEYVVCQPPDLRLGGQVRDKHVHLTTASCADLAGRVIRAAAVAAGDREVGTHRGQPHGGRFADTSASTGY